MNKKISDVREIESLLRSMKVEELHFDPTYVSNELHKKNLLRLFSLASVVVLLFIAFSLWFIQPTVGYSISKEYVDGYIDAYDTYIVETVDYEGLAFIDSHLEMEKELEEIEPIDFYWISQPLDFETF